MEETLTDAVELNKPSDSSSDSESSDDEAQSALEIQTLANELSSNPANYDAHVQVTNSLQYICVYSFVVVT